MKEESKIRIVAGIIGILYVIYAVFVFVIGANCVMRAFGFEIIKPAAVDKEEDHTEVKKNFEEEDE